MNVLLTGAQGQVASDIAALMQHYDQFELSAPSHQECDISDEASLQRYINTCDPDLVINAAAYTKVDQAEVEQAQAFNTNALGAKYLAQCCQQRHMPLLHFSTDFVFDGLQKQTYRETDQANPLSYYGKTKYQGEQFVQSILNEHVIVRLAGVFGLHGHNFIKTILRAASRQSTLKVVNDQYVTPTGTQSIAKMSLKLCQQLESASMAQFPWGIYHYSSQEVLTWYDFACYCIEQAKQYRTLAVKTIIPITTKAYNAKAKRPLYPILNCDKIQVQFSIEQPNWQTEVNELIKSLLQDEKSI